MENKSLSVAVGVILIVLVGALVWWQKSTRSSLPLDTNGAIQEASAPTQETTQDTNSTTSAAPAPDPAPVQPVQKSGVTSAQVAAHNSRQSCWSTINGSVYDLTSWIPQHPGGEQAILQLCGTDGSAKFNGQHGGAVKQAAVLVGFKIGSATP